MFQDDGQDFDLTAFKSKSKPSINGSSLDNETSSNNEVVFKKKKIRRTQTTTLSSSILLAEPTVDLSHKAAETATHLHQTAEHKTTSPSIQTDAVRQPKVANPFQAPSRVSTHVLQGRMNRDGGNSRQLASTSDHHGKRSQSRSDGYPSESSYHEANDLQSAKDIQTHHQMRRLAHQRDANAWELERLSMGAGHLSREIDLDAIEQHANEEHVIIYSYYEPPAFLAKHGNIFLDSNQRKSSSGDDSSNDLASPWKSSSNSTSLVVRDPNGDIMRMARQGSFAVRDYRLHRDRHTNRDKYWDIKHQRMGQITGHDKLLDSTEEIERSFQEQLKSHVGGYVGHPLLIQKQLLKDKELYHDKAGIDPNLKLNSDAEPTSPNSIKVEHEDNMTAKPSDHSELKSINSTLQVDPEHQRSLERLKMRQIREGLPVFQYRYELLRLLRENQIVIVVGETGSGKTTQLAQYLYEEGYTRVKPTSNSNQLSSDNGLVDDFQVQRIGITQPRRVAAISVAKRVAEEMDVEIGSTVGYAIRFEDCTSPSTAIKFMTDGILLRETLSSEYLDNYSCIIMDEAHERSLNTDILFGLLRNICSRRNDLKVIVTSATMNAEKFSQFFGGAPILNIHGRTYPVEVVYNAGMPSDYVVAAAEQVIKIHLQHVTSQDEQVEVVDTQHPSYTAEENQPTQATDSAKDEVLTPSIDADQALAQPLLPSIPPPTASDDTAVAVPPHSSPEKRGSMNSNRNVTDGPPMRTVTIRSLIPNGDILVFMTGQDDIETCCHLIKKKMEELEISLPLNILPIHSTLPQEVQAQIFSPSTIRKVIVATNIAETSLTVDGVRYVVDSGLCKLKTYNPSIGIDMLTVTPISQASANQRSGRAGRTSSGIAYRLYTQHVFTHELLHNNVAEIYRTNLNNVVLMLKAIYRGDILGFNFLERPSDASVLSSLYHLYILGALDSVGELTDIGRIMALLPLDPPISRMLVEGIKLNCLGEVVTVCAMLSVQNIFHRPTQRMEQYQAAHQKLMVPEGDILTLLNIYNLWAHHHYSQTFATDHYLQHKALVKAREIRSQLCQFLSTPDFIRRVAQSLMGAKPGHQATTSASHERQAMNPFSITGGKVKTYGRGNSLTAADHQRLKQIEEQYRDTLRGILSIRSSNSKSWYYVRKCVCAGYFTNACKVKTATHYQCIRNGLTCEVHPTSSIGAAADFIVYQELVMTEKQYMRGVCEVEHEWLLEYGPMMFKMKQRKSSL